MTKQTSPMYYLDPGTFRFTERNARARKIARRKRGGKK